MKKYIDKVPKIVKIGLPLLAGNLSFFLLNFADTAMVGQINKENLGAIAMAGIMSGIFFTFLWPLAVGVQVMASRRFGKEMKENRTDMSFTGQVLDNGLLISLCLGILTFIISYISPYVFSKTISDQAVIPFANDYISIMRIIYIFGGIVMAISGFLCAIRKTTIIMYTTLGTNALNICLNYIFIFGKLGSPAMGIKGAALGTVIAFSLQGLFFIGVLFQPSLSRKFNYLRFKAINFNILKAILTHYYPPMVQNVGAFAIIYAFEAMVGTLGTIYLGATHVIFQLLRINKAIVGGFAQGSSILVGNYLGAGKKEDAFNTVAGSGVIGAIIGVAVLATVLIIPGPIAKIFTPDPAIIEIAIQGIRVMAVFFLIEILAFSIEINFTHNGMGLLVLISEFSTNVVFLLIAAALAIFVFKIGIMGAWISFALYQVFHAIILWIGFLSKGWLNKQIEHA